MRWQLTKRAGRGAVHITAYGQSLALPRSSGSLSNYFYFGEAFEWDIISFLRAFARPGDVIVDGGANVGMFTYAAWQAVSPSGRVESFEPIPQFVETIRRNLARNGLGGGASVHQAALSDAPGVVRFTADLDVSNHIVEEGGAREGRSYIEVPTVRIDDLVAGPVALLKLDVEGAEFQALQGCRQLIEKEHPPAIIMIEAHDHSLRQLGSSRAEVLNHLDSWGYRPLEYDAGSGHLRILNWHDVRDADDGDVICGHEKSQTMIEDRLRWGGRVLRP